MDTAYSNVDHPRKRQKRTSLPLWFYRVLDKAGRERRSCKPEDFDQDISEYEESGYTSEESFEGADTNIYQRYKAMREGRKRQLKSMQEQEEAEYDEEHDDEEHDDEEQEGEEQEEEGGEEEVDEEEDEEELGDEDEEVEEDEEKEGEDEEGDEEEEEDDEQQEQDDIDQEQEFQAGNEKEVDDAEESLKRAIMNGERLPRLALEDAYFNLYCGDYVNYSWDPLDGYPRHIEFYGALNNVRYSPPTKPLEGKISFDDNAECNFTAFIQPKNASLNGFQLKDVNGNHKFLIQFFSNDYLRIRVSRELVFQGKIPPPHTPEFFDFSGIRFDVKKARAKRAREEQMVRKRPRSESSEASERSEESVHVVDAFV
ncbi:hypothetical protein ASPWEDRAFT_41369 [Aspergillus wentii DTO 134E9]|uniref:Uncharacterized protein n=1 Tax=Aspergillus wentii DTO 134E9 TaxID=1073089 RepID=A0A1L9RMF5_ASPWE|nr:uncharacterized protein ASPWEDRAFT_41369 [Aspergillus wentii DTO 134E9]KAI9929417.1 hypothetical protein MW887_000887 [Aspergillus wentii]OJJ36140.1 hypothetical protein ASPWEDRAFT_41369 [Aspergillus wentii DTO 134E9]